MAAELDGQKANNRKSNSARGKNQAKEAPAGISKGAGARNDQGKWKWRRGETSNSDSDASLFAHSSFEIFQTPRCHHLLQPLFTAFATDQIKKDNSERGADSRGYDIQRQMPMIANGQDDHQKVISKRKEEEGRVGGTEKQGSENAEAEQPCEEISEKTAHARWMLTLPSM